MIPGMFTVEVEREPDSGWIAEVSDLPGVPTAGQTREEAVRKAQRVATRVLAEYSEHGEN